MEYNGVGDADANRAGTLSMEGDEHARLVTEMPAMQRLPIGERLLLARRRRLEQVTRYESYDRRLRRDASATHHARNTATGRRAPSRSLRFVGAVSLLGAVRDHDINEGSSTVQSLRYI